MKCSYEVIFSILMCALLSLNNVVNATGIEDSPQGWHWYNEEPTKKIKKIKNKKGELDSQTSSSQSALDQLHAVQHAFNEAKAKAVLYPTEENIYRYLALQNAITEQSTRFAMMWPKVFLDHPDLDYSINHPTAQLAIQAKHDKEEAEKIATVKSLSQQYGLVFFYRGNETGDEVMAKSINDFANQYGLAFIPITIDQHASPDLPNTRMDSGQAQSLGVKYYPALILVNPKTGVVKPLAYGFMAEDKLLDRFLDVAKDFQENW